MPTKLLNLMLGWASPSLKWNIMSSTASLKEVTWAEISQTVASVNPELAAIIDELKPDAQHTLFLAKYPYGSEILIHGKLFLPDVHGQLVDINDPRISQDTREKLNYIKDTNPLTLVLNNSMELFIPTENRVITYSLIEPGTVMGVWGVLEYYKKKFLFYTPIPLWGMTAGARSTFLLPKVSEIAAFNKIQKKYAIKSDTPKNLVDHWPVFRDIASHPSFEQPWTTEVLFFSKKWIESIHRPEWHKFKTYISNLAWNSSEFWRSQFCLDLTFSRIQERRGIKPCPFVADIASHLLFMSMGALPGFKPLTDNSALPLDGLRRVFEEEYGCRYAPIIMGPASLNVLDSYSGPAYYSFHYHTAIKLSQKSSSRSSTLTDLYNVRSLLSKYLEDIQDGDLKISDTVLYEMAKAAQFSFAHYDASADMKMATPNALIEQDPAFQTALAQCQIKTLPKKSPFLNGCIQLSKK